MSPSKSQHMVDHLLRFARVEVEEAPRTSLRAIQTKAIRNTEQPSSGPTSDGSSGKLALKQVTEQALVAITSYKTLLMGKSERGEVDVCLLWQTVIEHVQHAEKSISQIEDTASMSRFITDLSKSELLKQNADDLEIRLRPINITIIGLLEQAEGRPPGEFNRMG